MQQPNERKEAFTAREARDLARACQTQNQERANKILMGKIDSSIQGKARSGGSSFQFTHDLDETYHMGVIRLMCTSIIMGTTKSDDIPYEIKLANIFLLLEFRKRGFTVVEKQDDGSLNISW